MIRLLDIFFSIIGILLSIPIFVIVFVFSFFNRGSFLYKQKRLGYKNKSFYLFKIRTMKIETKQLPTHELNENSLNYYGGLLRKTKIDELPQFLNVLKGDMSLVGYRPCLLSQEELINERNKFNISLTKPGITGLSQINKIDMSNPILLAKSDYEMIKNFSIFSYFKYIFLTFFGSGFGDRIK